MSSSIPTCSWAGVAAVVLLLAVRSPAVAQGSDTGGSSEPGATTRGASEETSTRYESILDSLRTDSDSLFRWDDAASRVGWADPDTGLWRPDIDGIPASRTKFASIDFVPDVFQHTKVDGVIVGGGVRARVFRSPSIRISAKALRAFHRGTWMGEVSALWSPHRMRLEYPRSLRSRLTGGGAPRTGLAETPSRRTSWAIIGGWSDRSRVFGSERAYAGSVQSALLGIDGQSYLERREAYGGVLFQAPTSRYGSIVEAELVYAETEESALSAAHQPLFNTDPRLWPNARAAERTSGGLTLWSQWGNIVTGIGKSTGTQVRTRLSTRGAQMGAGAEVHTYGAEVLHRRAAPGAESVDVELRGSAIGGGNSLVAQDAADLGGPSSLRAFPPRSLLGATSLLGRFDYIWAYDPMRRWNIPLLRHLRVQPVLFADAGAVWSPRGAGASGTAGAGSASPTWQSLSSLHSPRSADWRFDWGIGLQRNLGFPGLLGRARVDFGFRTDRSTDRLRVSFSLSP